MKGKNIAIGIGIIALGISGYLIYKALAKPTEDECTGGEVKCKGKDLYQCIDGEFQLVKSNAPECTEAVDCPNLSESECKSSLKCRWCKPEDSPDSFSCLSIDKYPYKCTICDICFKTASSKQAHKNTYHPDIKFKTLDGIGVKSTYCGFTRDGRIYFDLGRKVFIQTIAGKIKIGGYDTVKYLCVVLPGYVDCYVDVGFYLDGERIGYKRYRVGSEIDLSSALPPIGKVGQRLIIDIEQITDGCCYMKSGCYHWLSPPYFASGRATFICGIV